MSSTRTFTFAGEESARFTSFAAAALAAGLADVVVQVDGREPLTSRPVFIRGKLTAALRDGYIRYITVVEDKSGISHNIAGSNATRSIASRFVTIRVPEDSLPALRNWAEKTETLVPLLGMLRVPGYAEFARCEAALGSPSEGGVRDVLSLLESPVALTRTEAALTLRALSRVANDNPQLRAEVESRLISFCIAEPERDATVAGIEDLGYVGDEPSHRVLAEQVARPRCEQACWASVVALGRLSGGEDVWRPLLTALDGADLWARRAALLCLGRRATPDLQDELEHVFARYLGAGVDDLLRRYACLGLSRFRQFSELTWNALLATLADEGTPLGTKGYAGLAIANAYQRCPPDIHRRIENLLGTIVREGDLRSPDIDAVWSLEYLGELASISGLPHLAARLYRMLSQLFTDWRSPYYLAISSYELGEAEALRSEGEDAVVRFTEALRQLSIPVGDLPEAAAATVEFRRNIVSARRQLQSLFATWVDSHDAETIRNLLPAVDNIRNQYNLYATAEARIGRERTLVRREIDYLRTTVLFLLLIRRLLELDARVRNSDLTESDVRAIRYAIAQAEATGTELRERLGSISSVPLSRLLSDVGRALTLMKEAASAQVSTIDQLNLMRGYIVQVRAAFWKSTWPLPGRACPVYGLGRASLGLRPGTYSGTGSHKDPIRFPPGTRCILPLYVHIADMAVGGNAQLRIIYEIAGTSREVPVHAVEDEYPVPIDVSEFASLGDFVVDVRAVFYSRDCTQDAARRSITIAGGL